MPAVAVALAIAALAWAMPIVAMDEPLEEALAEAERLNRAAAAAGYEWLETAGLLEQARRARAEGNEKQAAELVQQATLQAGQALEQAQREAVAWQRRVVR